MAQSEPLTKVRTLAKDIERIRKQEETKSVKEPPQPSQTQTVTPHPNASDVKSDTANPPPFHTLRKEPAESKKTPPKQIRLDAETVSKVQTPRTDSQHDTLNVSRSGASETTATIVTDKKRARPGFFRSMGIAFTQWANDTKASLLGQNKPVYTVSSSARRAGILRDATTASGVAQFDHESLAKRIRERYKAQHGEEVANEQHLSITNNVDPAFLPELPEHATVSDVTTTPRQTSTQATSEKPAQETTDIESHQTSTSTSAPEPIRRPRVRLKMAQEPVSSAPSPAPVLLKRRITTTQEKTDDTAPAEREKKVAENTTTTFAQPRDFAVHTSTFDKQTDTTPIQPPTPAPTHQSGPAISTEHTAAEAPPATDIDTTSQQSPSESVKQRTPDSKVSARDNTSVATSRRIPEQESPDKPTPTTPPARVPNQESIREPDLAYEPDVDTGEAVNTDQDQAEYEYTTPTTIEYSYPKDQSGPPLTKEELDELEAWERQRQSTNQMTLIIAAMVLVVIVLGYALLALIFPQLRGETVTTAVATQYIGDRIATVDLAHSDSVSDYVASIEQSIQSHRDTVQISFVTRDSDGQRDIASARTTATALRLRMPNELVQSLRFIHAGGVMGEPFLLLVSSNRSQSRAGMLLWEPQLVSDMSILFGSSEPQGEFTDTTIEGNDARIVRREDDSLLIYIFTRHGIILANSIEVGEAALASLR